mgnify:CR=1 FL=1
MKQNEIKKYEKINKLLVKLTVSSFLLTIVFQFYLNMFIDREIILLSKLQNREDMNLKQLDMIPKYGEIIFKVSEKVNNKNFRILINGEKKDFVNGSAKIQVKDGDLIEFMNYDLSENTEIIVEYVSSNIKNFKKNDVLDLKTDKVLLIKIP